MDDENKITNKQKKRLQAQDKREDTPNITTTIVKKT